MIVRGRASLAAPRAEVMAVLSAPERLVTVLPNVDDFDWDAEADGSFAATIRPAIALGEVPFRTVWQPRQASDGLLRYRVEGRADEQWLGMDVELALRDDGAATGADWSIDLQLTGTMRTAGQRVMAAVVAAQVQTVLDAVARAAAGAQE